MAMATGDSSMMSPSPSSLWRSACSTIRRSSISWTRGRVGVDHLAGAFRDDDLEVVQGGAQRFLGDAALGEVGRDAFDVLDASVDGEGLPGEAEPARISGAGEKAVLLDGRAIAVEVFEPFAETDAVLLLHVILDRVAGHLGGLVSEDGLDAGACVGDAAVGHEGEDDLADRVEDVAVPFLGLDEGGVLAMGEIDEGGHRERERAEGKVEPRMPPEWPRDAEGRPEAR